MNSSQYKRTIKVYIDAPTAQIAETIVKALQPEISTSHAFGSRVHIKSSANKLHLTIETNRTSTIRAVLNSYLRWMEMITNSIKILSEEKSIMN